MFKSMLKDLVGTVVAAAIIVGSVIIAFAVVIQCSWLFNL